MKSLTQTTTALAYIMHLGAGLTLEQSDALWEEPTILAEVDDELHPELYDIEDEGEKFDDAIEQLDNTWDDAEAQIRWWQTVPVGWPNFVGTWHNTWGEATDDTDKWNGHGDLVVRADGTWNSRTDNDGTAWWDGRHRVNFKRGKDDSDDCIGTFVDGYLRVER